MPSKNASRSNSGLVKGWWLGPVIVYFCMLAAMLLFGILVSPFKISADILTVVEQWVVYAIPLIIIYLHVRRFERKKKFWQSVGVRRKNLGQSLIWVFALFVVFTGITAIYWQTTTSTMGEDPRGSVDAYFEGENFEDLDNNGKHDPGEPFTDFNDNGERDSGFPDWYFGYVFFASFVPVAISEELIFRGFTLDRFLAKGPIFAILASSIMFSSLHLWYIGFGISSLPLYGGVFLLAIWWGIVYWKTRNIVGLAIIHGLNNASLSAGHFFGSSAVAAMSATMFIIGIACLGFLLRGCVSGCLRRTKLWLGILKHPNYQ